MGPQGTLHGHDNALLCLPLYFFISTGLCWLTTVCCPTREHVLYLTAANRQRSAQRWFPMHLAPEFPESPDARGTMGVNGRNRGKGACVCGKAWPTRPNAFVVWICLRQKWIRTGAAGHEFWRGPRPRIGAAEAMRRNQRLVLSAAHTLPHGGWGVGGAQRPIIKCVHK